MTNAELIKTLRWCGSDDERHEMCVDESYSCPMWNEDRMTDYCKADLMLAAADLIEAQEKALDECAKQLADMAAQLPKEGEWIDAFVGELPVQVCSKCNTFFPLAYTGGGHHYCPNCGSVMKGEQE